MDFIYTTNFLTSFLSFRFGFLRLYNLGFLPSVFIHSLISSSSSSFPPTISTFSFHSCRLSPLALSREDIYRIMFYQNPSRAMMLFWIADKGTPFENRNQRNTEERNILCGYMYLFIKKKGWMQSHEDEFNTNNIQIKSIYCHHPIIELTKVNFLPQNEVSKGKLYPLLLHQLHNIFC